MKQLLMITLVCSAALSSLALADDDLANGVSTCAAETDDAERLACYDQLASSIAATPASDDSAVADEESAAEPTAEAQKPQELTDAIGGGEFADAAGAPEKSYAGRVTSCKKSADRRWFYIFDNGQVWKQVDRRKRRHKNCEFDVLLTEDNFGYVMKIVDEDTEVRVARRR